MKVENDKEKGSRANRCGRRYYLLYCPSVVGLARPVTCYAPISVQFNGPEYGIILHIFSKWIFKNIYIHNNVDTHAIEA